MTEFFLFLLVGFLAQAVDGALGMAYGVICATVLASSGIPPAQVSATVHFSKLFTTAGSAAAHGWQRNVDWKLLLRLAPFGIVGGVVGAVVLTSIDASIMRPIVTAYLGLVGVWLLVRSFKSLPEVPIGLPFVAPLGTVGGFLDAIGGGGWGPVVTTGLLGAGAPPRFAVGTVNTAEFFVTLFVAASFAIAFASGSWDGDGSFETLFPAIAGLVLGGLLAAPFGALFVKHVRQILLLRAVGTLITLIAVYQSWRFFG